MKDKPLTCPEKLFVKLAADIKEKSLYIASVIGIQRETDTQNYRRHRVHNFHVYPKAYRGPHGAEIPHAQMKGGPSRRR